MTESVPFKNTRYDLLDKIKGNHYRLDSKTFQYSAEGTSILLVTGTISSVEVEHNQVLSAHQGFIFDNMVRYCQTVTETSLKQVSVTPFKPVKFNDEGAYAASFTLLLERMFTIANDFDIIVISGHDAFTRIMRYFRVLSHSKKAVDWRKYLHRIFQVKYKGKTYKIMGTLEVQKLATQDPKETGAYPNLMGLWCRGFIQAIEGKNWYTLSVPLETLPEKCVYIDTLDKFKAFYQKLIKARQVYLDTETKDLGRIVNKLYSIQFSFNASKAYFLPLYHPQTPFTSKELTYIAIKLKHYFEFGESQFHCWHNASFDLTILRIKQDSLGVRYYKHKLIDTTGTTFSLDENQKFLVRYFKDQAYGPFRLDTLCNFYGCNVYNELLFSKDDRAHMEMAALDDALVQYACVDVLVLPTIIKYQFHEAIKRQEQSKFFNLHTVQYDAMIKAFVAAESTGALIDKKYLASQMAKDSSLNKEIEKAEIALRQFPSVQTANTQLLKEAGLPSGTGLFGQPNWVFSSTKPEHKARLFFNILDLKPLDIGKNGKGKIDKVFQEQYKTTPEVKGFTELSKIKTIKNSFFKGINRTISESDARDSRIRCKYSFLSVVTGRIAGTDPNLLNIPSRGPLAKIVKRLFIAKPRNLLLKIDFCLAGSTLIQSERGLVRIDSLVPHNSKVSDTKTVDLSLKVASVSKPAKTAHWTYTGHKSTIKVTTKSGNSIIGTDNHRLRVLRDGTLLWLPIAKCKVGDFLCLNSRPFVRKTQLELKLSEPIRMNSNNANVFSHKRYKIYYVCMKNNGEYDYLPGSFTDIESAVECRSRYHSKLGKVSLKKPDVMTPSLAYIIGCLIADGNFTINKRYNSLSFSNSDKAFIDRYTQELGKTFGLKVKPVVELKRGIVEVINGVPTEASKDHWVVRLRSKQIITWLLELGLYDQNGLRNGKITSHYKRVPWSILQADGESQLAFLAAYLEACGKVRNKPHTVAWDSVSCRLLSDIRLILNSHGFITYDTENSSAKSINLSRGASQRFWAKVKPYMVTKSLEPYEAKHNDKVGLIPCLCRSKWFGYGAVRKQRDAELSGYKYYFTPIVSIKPAGIKPTYDLTMEASAAPAFVANGLIVHNCAHEIGMWSNCSHDPLLTKSCLEGYKLRVKYRLSPTTELKKDIDEKGDLHRLNHIHFFGRPPNNSDERDGVKTVVFAVVYGRKSKGLAKVLKCTEEHAQMLIDTLFSKFKKGGQFLTKTHARGKRNLKVFSPIGRCRHLPAYLHSSQSVHNALNRRGPNAIIQGVAADCLLQAVTQLESLIWHYFLKHDIDFYGVRLNYVHDAIENEVRFELIPIFCYLLEHSCTTLVHKTYREKFDFKLVKPLEIDFSFGVSLDSMKKWDYNMFSDGVEVTDKEGKAKPVPSLLTLSKSVMEDCVKMYPDYWTQERQLSAVKAFEHNARIIHTFRLKELELQNRSNLPNEVMYLTENNARSVGFIFEANPE